MKALRADQVGSLLRPSPLLQARVDFSAGRLDREGLRAEEDRAILDALGRQRDYGIDVRSDGEFRRVGFATGFSDAVDGFVKAELADLPWRGGSGPAPRAPSARVVGGRLAARGRVAAVESAFLLRHARGPFKITLPSPLLFAQFGYRPGLTDAAYASREELLADAARILAGEARALAGEGVPYVQLDAPAYAQWLDPAAVSARRAAGVDANRLLDSAIDADNLILDAARSGGAVTGVHLCRGNSMGRWLVEGGYDPIAERLFNRLRCDRVLLEYDTARAGTFAPLRFVPAGRIVVLGLVTTKSGELEPAEELVRRIDAAARILPLEQLALSPQCGFASSQVGNPLTHEQQWRKLELVARVAREVWP